MSISVTNLSNGALEVGGVILRKGQTKTNVPDSGLDEVKALAAQSLVSYVWTPDTPAASFTAQQVAQTQALVLRDGNLAAIAKLGRVPQLLCGLGNSITAAHSSWWKSACRASGGTMIAGTNAGITGNTSAQIAARYAADVPTGARLVTLMEGSNDASNGVTVAAHVSAMRTTIEGLLARGQLPLFAGTPPRNSYAGIMHAYRLADYALAREYQIPFALPWEAYAHTDGSGSWASSASTDGIHPTTAVQEAAGIKAWQQWTGQTPAIMLPTAQAITIGAIQSNAMMLTDTNADGIPDGWSSTAASGATKVNALASAGLGNWFSVEMTGSTSGSSYVNISRAFTTGFSPGNTLQWVGRIKTEGMSNAMLKFYLVCTGGTTTEVILHQYMLDNLADATHQMEFVVPAGTTTITLYALLQATASGGVGKVSIAQQQLWNLTTALT